jgi:uncharacterized repeat protein (TIGR02543 family)
MKTKHGILFSFAVLLMAAIFTLAGCKEPSSSDDPSDSDEITCTVSFESNGGTPTPRAQTVTAGYKVSQPAAIAKSGNTFGGWYRDSALSYAWDFASHTVTADITLYAKWIPAGVQTYTVSFESNGGTPTPTAQTVAAGGKVTRPADMTKEGNTFGGWYKETDEKEGFWNFATDTVTTDITLYAEWIPTGVQTYTVSFESNGGTPTPTAQTVAAGGKVTQPAAMTKAGNTFGGWYKEAALTTTWDFATDTVTAAITLYAKWEPSGTSDGIKKLDAAMKEAASDIDERIAKETTVALLNFESPTDQFTQYVFVELTANLINSGKLVIVDRKEIELIREELNFQYSGEVSEDTMQKAGVKLGAKSIISGALSKIGDVYRVVVQVLNVESAKIEVQYRTDIENDSRVQALLDGAQKTEYKIGDTGPGGGMVFFAEGGSYMECSGELGRCSWSEAVEIAKDHKGGAYTDWHLPTKNELDLMYQNLDKKDLGSFNIGWYWSSSTASNTDNAWTQLFRASGYYGNSTYYYSGSQYDKWSKTANTLYARAVRAF